MRPEKFAIASIYEDKPAAYFAGSRDDIVQRLGTDATSSILELGCGTGATGLSALCAGKAGRYVGIELDERAADSAKAVLSQVLVGDVAAMDLSDLHGQFDALIISEVLEHLTDPWTTLAQLVACLKPGAEVYASSPNISHWWVIRDLLAGRFVYAADGVMDSTHLRWFTPASFRQMFEAAGVKVSGVGPLVAMRWKPRMFDRLTGGRFSHLFTSQIMLTGRV
jgi:2-polyprenyl-3-methyl-5-hydroxy-6-metoxy-1,4-benzoquinol methylase